MPLVRTCKSSGRKNRIPAKHLAETGRCGACKSPSPPVDEPLEVDPEQFDESRKTPESRSRLTPSAIRSSRPISMFAAYRTLSSSTAVVRQRNRPGWSTILQMERWLQSAGSASAALKHHRKAYRHRTSLWRRW